MDMAPPRLSCLMLASSLQVLIALASAGTPPAHLHTLAHGAFNAGVNAHSMFSAQRTSSNHLYALEEGLLKQTGMFQPEPECESEEYVLPDAQRKRALAAGDAIAAVTPKNVLAQSIQGLQAAVSPEVFQAVIAGIDPDILKQVGAITQQP